MTRLSTSLVAAAGLILAPSLAFSQTHPSEAALRAAFERTTVEVRIDMPGTSDGVDVRSTGLDSKQHLSRLKQYGTALTAGQHVTVTMIKVKKDLIEFQLDGGGFGTFGDDTSTSADMPDVPKSNYEKDLERRVKSETDSQRKRTLQRELDDIRNGRDRENRRIASTRRIIEDNKRRDVARRRLEGGSRFNLRYTGVVPTNVTPGDVVTMLQEYVDFVPADSRDSGAARGDGDEPATLRKGLPKADVVRMLGDAIETSERREGALRVTTLIFRRGDERITAGFVEDVLIRYSIVVK